MPYLGGFAKLCSLELRKAQVVRLCCDDTQQLLNTQKMDRTTHASTKSKEVQANTQPDTIAPHLLLHQPTSDSLLKLSIS